MTDPSSHPENAFSSWREPIHFQSLSSLPSVQQSDAHTRTDSSGDESDVDESNSEMPITPFRRSSLHPESLQTRPNVLRKVSHANIHLFDREPVVERETRGKRSNSIGSGLLALEIMEPEPPWMSKLTLCSPRAKPKPAPRPNRINLLLAEETHAVEREIALEREVQVILHSALPEELPEEAHIPDLAMDEPPAALSSSVSMSANSLPDPLSTAIGLIGCVSRSANGSNGGASGSNGGASGSNGGASGSNGGASGSIGGANASSGGANASSGGAGVTPGRVTDGETDDDSIDGMPPFPNSICSYSSYSSNDSMDVRPPERRMRRKLKQRLSFPHSTLHLGFNMQEEDVTIPSSPTLSPSLPTPTSFSIPHLRPTYRGIKRSANSMDTTSRGSTPPPGVDAMRSATSSTMSSPNLGYQRSHPYKRHHRTGSGQWTGASIPSIPRSKPMSIPMTMDGSKSPGGTPPPADALMGSPHNGYASPRFGHNVQMAPGAMLNLTEAQEVLARTRIENPQSQRPES